MSSNHASAWAVNLNAIHMYDQNRYETEDLFNTCSIQFKPLTRSTYFRRLFYMYTKPIFVEWLLSKQQLNRIMCEISTIDNM